MKVVMFIKPHNYGGHLYKNGDMLECPSERAALLEKIGVATEMKPTSPGKKKHKDK